jgi:predicted HTH transcriptional regulator
VNSEWAIEQLKTDTYQSRTRNKLIAEAFYLTGDIEKYGSGFIRVREAIKDYPKDYPPIDSRVNISRSFNYKGTSG